MFAGIFCKGMTDDVGHTQSFIWERVTHHAFLSVDNDCRFDKHNPTSLQRAIPSHIQQPAGRCVLRLDLQIPTNESPLCQVLIGWNRFRGEAFGHTAQLLVGVTEHRGCGVGGQPRRAA